MQKLLTFAAFGLITICLYAQNHIVDTVGFSFVDSVSGTNITTITLGQTIEWKWIGGASHTATSGIDSSDPNAGLLFNGALNSVSTSYTYTPTAVGTLAYFCIPHQFFGMLGTIQVTPAATYPGSGEDFELGTAVNRIGQPYQAPTFDAANDVKTALTGDAVSIVMRSTNGTFDFVPLILVAQVFLPGNPPIGPLSGLHVNAAGGLILLNGLETATLPPIVLPFGVTYGVAVPPGLVGLSVMFQALAIAGSANNMFFAITNGHEIMVQ